MAGAGDGSDGHEDREASEAAALELSLLDRILYRSRSQHRGAKYFSLSVEEQIETGSACKDHGSVVQRTCRLFAAPRITSLLEGSLSLLARVPDKRDGRARETWIRSTAAGLGRIRTALLACRASLDAIIKASKHLAHQVSQTYFMAVSMVLLACLARLFACNLFLAGRLLEVHGALLRAMLAQPSLSGCLSASARAACWIPADTLTFLSTVRGAGGASPTSWMKASERDAPGERSSISGTNPVSRVCVPVVTSSSATSSSPTGPAADGIEAARYGNGSEGRDEDTGVRIGRILGESPTERRAGPRFTGQAGGDGSLRDGDAENTRRSAAAGEHIVVPPASGGGAKTRRKVVLASEFSDSSSDDDDDHADAKRRPHQKSFGREARAGAAGTAALLADPQVPASKYKPLFFNSRFDGGDGGGDGGGDAKRGQEADVRQSRNSPVACASHEAAAAAAAAAAPVTAAGCRTRVTLTPIEPSAPDTFEATSLAVAPAEPPPPPPPTRSPSAQSPSPGKEAFEQARHVEEHRTPEACPADGKRNSPLDYGEDVLGEGGSVVADSAANTDRGTVASPGELSEHLKAAATEGSESTPLRRVGCVLSTDGDEARARSSEGAGSLERRQSLQARQKVYGTGAERVSHLSHDGVGVSDATLQPLSEASTPDSGVGLSSRRDGSTDTFAACTIGAAEEPRAPSTAAAQGQHQSTTSIPQESRMVARGARTLLQGKPDCERRTPAAAAASGRAEPRRPDPKGSARGAKRMSAGEGRRDNGNKRSRKKKMNSRSKLAGRTGSGVGRKDAIDDIFGAVV